MTSAAVPVYLEVGKRKTFAGAVAWPGWCRWGKDPDLALEALAAAAPRYDEVATAAGMRFDPQALDFEVVAQWDGTATTDFGAPDLAGDFDHVAVDAAEAHRLVALLRASWAVFDRVRATAPAELRKGPRGGGRDRDKMVAHVLGAEAGYARQIGVKLREPAVDDEAAIAELRDAVSEVLGTPSDGSRLVQPKGWTQRYAVRRFAWHVLDHVWEMQDRSEP